MILPLIIVIIVIRMMIIARREDAQMVGQGGCTVNFHTKNCQTKNL